METHTPLSEPPLQVTAGFCFRAGFVGTLRRREGVPCPCPQLTRKAALPEIQEEKGMSGGAKSLNALPPAGHKSRVSLAFARCPLCHCLLSSWAPEGSSLETHSVNGL